MRAAITTYTIPSEILVSCLQACVCHRGPWKKLHLEQLAVAKGTGTATFQAA